MPSYKVIKPCFIDGKTYAPGGKRDVYHADKPFKKVPSSLEPIKGETAAEAKKRKAAEKKAAEAAEKKAAEDKKDIDAVTFTEPPSPAVVETL